MLVILKVMNSFKRRMSLAYQIVMKVSNTTVYKDSYL